MNVEILIKMANQIGAFFESMPDREAALEGVAHHLQRFWEPRMRKQLLDALDARESDALSDIVRDSVERHRYLLIPTGGTNR